MNPEIRYATASDGVRIAYWKLGRGPALVDLPVAAHDNVALITTIAEYRVMVEAIARETTYVKYDARGFGSSDRDVADLSLDAMVRDLEAVVDAAGLPKFAINAWAETAAIALAYAAIHPDRVQALVLADGFARGADRQQAVNATAALARTDWALAKRSLADHTPNILSVSSLRQMHKVIDKTATQDAYLRYVEQMAGWDASPVLSQVLAPALVTNDGLTGIAQEVSRSLAAALPAGSLVSAKVLRGEPSPIDREIRSFLRRAFAGDAASEERTSAASHLTPREIEVLRLLASGRSNRQIAEDLTLSERTVVRHIANIYAKIDAHGRADATAYALRHRLA